MSLFKMDFSLLMRLFFLYSVACFLVYGCERKRDKPFASPLIRQKTELVKAILWGL